MVNLVPLAGEGKRFVNEGYSVPKPLIKVSGKPMVIQAAQALPESNQWVFICLRAHIESYQIDKTLKGHFSEAKIVAIDHVTNGQASTCLHAEKHIHHDDELLVGPCDSSAIWNKNNYYRILSEKKVDALIWTFRSNPAVKRNPQMYGWVKTDNNHNVLGVSCKVPLSENPLQDHAIIGTFYFKKAAFFFQSIKQMIMKCNAINNEYYIDEAMNEAIKMGLNVKIFEVDKYIGWGTPNDLKTYQYWEKYFNKSLERKR